MPPARPGPAAIFDGTYRDVRWYVEKGRADCAAPLVTLTSSEGLFFQEELPDACLAKVHALVDAELKQRAARSRGPSITRPRATPSPGETHRPLPAA